ncbi:glycoside hydrolase superfamily [Aspergillus minisclerotigenes]|uniref:Glycoside hydrolase superfamily n=1 Tax=Aspergillus minisclerotigenes TaxID=656917 RepID=A0A5N6IV47_9EURO|nr:glycoside hydrolase superfamily [Aspergillus minisclerotigenes]
MLAGEYAPFRHPVPSVWLDAFEKRVKGLLRTTAPDLLAAIDNYMSHVYKIIADAQITNGGPVILLQVENGYSMFEGEALGPDRQYMQYYIDKALAILVSLHVDLCFRCQKLSLYSIGGGTNWGNLGYLDFYSSYDLGAMIAEDDTVTREKYSEAKSQGQFFKLALATTLHGLSNQIQPRCLLHDIHVYRRVRY